MLETIVQEKFVPRTSLSTSRSSVDQQQLPPKEPNQPQQSQATGTGITNIATRPSPFAKRGLAGLFSSGNSASRTSLGGFIGSGPSTPSADRESTPELVGSDGGSQIINISPAAPPSPPGTPATAQLLRRVTEKMSEVGLVNGHGSRTEEAVRLGDEGVRTYDQVQT